MNRKNNTNSRNWIHAYESLRNIQEVMFIKGRFLYRCSEAGSAEYAVRVKGHDGKVTYYDRESASRISREINEKTWSLTLNMLEEYIDGTSDIYLVVGEKTIFSAFQVQGIDENATRRVTKQLYRFLRDELGIPQMSLIVYQDGSGGYILAVLFPEAVDTCELNGFQQYVERCLEPYALKCYAKVKCITHYRSYVALPFGRNPDNNERRSLVSANTFKPIEKLKSYAISHVEMGSEDEEKLLNMDFKAMLSSTPEQIAFIGEEAPDSFAYPDKIYLSDAETAFLCRQKKKAVRMILLVTMLCGKLTLGGDAAPVSISFSSLKSITGLAMSTVKSTVAELCDSHILTRTGTAASGVQVDPKRKGPNCYSYALGQAALREISPCSAACNSYELSGRSVGVAAYLGDSSFFVNHHNLLMSMHKLNS